ncbi:MAG: DUF433 domain-containing protein [Verrucomicrobiales bacterium]|nr:DUF433 domain-containing protein [Verrucomicrobiales bacterium]
MVNYRDYITIDSGKRGGKPCIRGLRITVYDILGWLAVGMSHSEILKDFPDLNEEDIRATLAFAADREHHLVAGIHEASFRSESQPSTAQRTRRYLPRQ